MTEVPSTTAELDKAKADDEDLAVAVAKALGMKRAELVSVELAPAGVVATTFDGVSMVRVPDDAPDVEGKTGWMLLVPPSDKWQGTQPVYAQPDELEGDAAGITEDAGEGEDDEAEPAEPPKSSTRKR